MNSRRRSLILAAAFAGAAHAADPLILLPPEPFACAITVTPHERPDLPPLVVNLRPVSAEIARAGQVTRMRIRWEDGRDTEVWRFNDIGLTLVKDPRRGSIGAQRGYDFLPPIFHMDPKGPWINWVTAGAPFDMDSLAGRECRHYRKSVLVARPVVAPSREEPPPKPVPAVYQLWIDPETLHPVAFDDGEALYEIAFQPAEAPAPPPDIQQVFQRYEHLLSPPRRR